MFYKYSHFIFEILHKTQRKLNAESFYNKHDQLFLSSLKILIFHLILHD